MSDAPVAPAGAASSAAPSSPSASEVVINQNPVNSVNPVGSQAPEKPHAERLKDSVQAAFDRASNPALKPERPKPKEAKPADARPGHNNPPEETPKLNLKKRPDEQQPPPRERAEHGHFAPRTPDHGPQAPTGIETPDGQRQDQPGKPYKQLPPHAPFAEPPQRISESARRDWADTPETVRGDIHRMHAEFSKAYQSYRGAAEAFQPIARFHQMAQQHGTTLEKALDNYTGIEAKLRSDPIAGLDQIVYNLGLTDPATNKRIDLRDIAYTVLSQSPEQLRMLQQGNAQQASNHQIGALHQEIAGLKNHLAQMQNAQQFSYTRSAIDQFAETHSRIDDPVFGEVVRREINLGFDLDTAYKRAELLLPATHAAQTRTTSAQTRPADRSIHGNPDVAPSNGASRRPQKPSGTVSDAVQNAMNRHAGRA